MDSIATLEGEQDLPPRFAAIFDILSNLKAGTLEFALPDGRVFRIDGAADGPHGRINVRNGEMFKRILRDGKTGFAEAYMDGWWDTPDLLALLDVLIGVNRRVNAALGGLAMVRLWDRVQHWCRRNTKEQARKNIARHYDLGNDFYRLWLDDSMTYSAALFDRGGDLETAQARKYEALCDSIALRQGDHVLEVGCGWGGFAEYAARRRGARVKGLTISQKQYDFARKRIFKAGLNERVEIVLQDYRDERGQYDAIASVEMFEAVGEKYWPTYFCTLRRSLKPGARAALQVITIREDMFDRYRRGVDFIQKHIFPGGMLPSPYVLDAMARQCGLKNLGSFEFGADYSRTLRHWHRRFNGAWGDIAALGFDDRFRRMWNYYLASCAAAFKAGTTDVTQITFGRA